MAGNNDGKVLNGQRYFPEDGYVVAFTQQMKDFRDATTAVGTARTEITPVDAASSRIVTYAIPTTALATLYRSAPVTVNVQLPPVLVGVTVTYNVNAVEGNGRTVYQLAHSSGTSGGLSFSPNASGRASLAILPDVSPEIREIYGQNVPATNYAFYMPDNSTKAQVLARLATICGTTVREWPVFKPVAHTIVVKGQEKSFTVSVAADHRDSWSTVNLSYSVDIRIEDSGTVGVTNKVVRLPACVHGDIFILNTSQSLSASAYAESQLPQINGTGGAPSFQPITTRLTSPTISVTGSVSPAILPQTQGGGIPTSGLYLFDLNTQPDSWEHVRCTATVVDFSIFS